MSAWSWPNSNITIWKWGGTEAPIDEDGIKIQMYVSDPFDVRNLYQLFCPTVDDKIKEQVKKTREKKNKYNEVGLDKETALDEISGTITEIYLNEILESNR